MLQLMPCNPVYHSLSCHTLAFGFIKATAIFAPHDANPPHQNMNS